MTFTQAETDEILHQGLSIQDVTEQIDLFKKGIPPTKLVAAATIGNGILKLSEEQISLYHKAYDNALPDLEVHKFVPASGAATRMFKFLHQFINGFDPATDSLNNFLNTRNSEELKLFIVGLEKFPFYELVTEKIKASKVNYDSLRDAEKIHLFITTMLSKQGLNYAQQPKGLVPFHTYKNNQISSAFEEHLFETVHYTSASKPTKIHFTISEKHRNSFEIEFERVKNKVQDFTSRTIETSFSYQKNSTNTIAVSLDNKPFKDDGKLLFRPSGHGALIENLNDLKAEIIFIKNIDNVVVYKHKYEVANYKKLLGGILVTIREKVFEYQAILAENKQTKAQIAEIHDFMSSELNVNFPANFSKLKNKHKIELITEKLNRPIRVCGMVKNEGEPGGGPFWINDGTGQPSLQIVESAQIDLSSKFQKSIFDQSTHFNPVDLVCSVTNYKGEFYNLLDFVDHSSAFITTKTKDGKQLKSLERPGLWNGSMARWNSIFVEVPLITFNPVKSVNDLLKYTHQIKYIG